MTERQILFSTAMVRAILYGRKTETRRVVKRPGDPLEITHAGMPCPPRRWPLGLNPACAAPPHGHVHVHLRYPGSPFDYFKSLRSPYGGPGDLLYVRETWATGATLDDMSPAAIGEKAVDAGWGKPWAPIVYRADGHFNCAVRPSEFRSEWGGQGKWRPSIHMPKWAARIWLRVAEVRIERLQEITTEGIRAEGVTLPRLSCQLQDDTNHRFAWIDLWDGINAKRGYPWASNPWVWVVRFETVSANGRPE